MSQKTNPHRHKLLLPKYLESGHDQTQMILTPWFGKDFGKSSTFVQQSHFKYVHILFYMMRYIQSVWTFAQSTINWVNDICLTHSCLKIRPQLSDFMCDTVLIKLPKISLGVFCWCWLAFLLQLFSQVCFRLKDFIIILRRHWAIMG